MSRPPRVYLGIDGGGTKTAACILLADGTEAGRGTGGPCNIATGDAAVVRASLQEAVAGAIRSAGLPDTVEFAAVCAGVAGYGSTPARVAFEEVLREVVPARQYRVDADFVVAYWGASGGAPGVLVSAGTGAVVFARDERGRTARADGRGFLLGDRGSAFSIARAVLAELIWRVDLGKKPRKLERRILREIGATDAAGVIDWVHHDFDPARIAALGSLIACWADDGDKQAQEALTTPMLLLAASAQQVIASLDMSPRKVPIYLAGGVWAAGREAAARAFARALVGLLRSGYEGAKLGRKQRLDLRDPLQDPAAGAALLAMQASQHG